MSGSATTLSQNLVRVLRLLSITLVLSALVWLGTQNYLIFHSLTELFSIIVAAAVFVIAWNVRDMIENGYLQFLGIALLSVAGIDLAHTLAYNGMGVFPGHGPDLPTQLWIAGRTLESVSLLIAPTFLSRRVRPLPILATYVCISAAVFLSTFVWTIFPACYVEGQGLTLFKIYAEYAICLILVLAMVRLLFHRSSFERPILVLLCASILATIVSELAFTQYANVYGNFNLTGHLLKVVSVVFIYKALVETGFRRPYALLYRSLAESEQKFRSAIESNMMGVVFADPITGEVAEANDEYLRIIGCARADLEAGKINWKRFTPTEILRSEEAEIATVISGRKDFNSFEKEYVRPDGTRVPVIIGGAFLDGTRSLMVAFVLDNTARKQAEETLRSSEEKFAKAFAQNATAIAITDMDGIYIDANEEFVSLFGYKRAELLGKSALDLNIARDIQARKSAFEDLKARGFYRNREFRVWNRAGQEFVALSSADVITLDGRQVVLASTLNITERKQAEEELRKAKEELELRVSERTRELAHRADQLRAVAGELTLVEQRERSRLAKILHDHLQQLLVAAKFRVAVLGRSADEVVKLAGKEVEELIDESIKSSRTLTAELSPPILHEAGLNEGLKWLARRMVDTQGLFVDLELQDIGTIPEDSRILLFESVRELLFNIVKHASVRSAIVHLRRYDDCLQIIVSDQGKGFDPASLPPAGEKGRGFGLFVIRERLELMGGRFEIQSSPGQGSRFILIMPVTSPASAMPDPPQQEVPPEPQPVTTNHAIQEKKIRVLLADDHAVVRQGIANLLEDQPDIEIIAQASDGQEAVDLASKLLPDVILMDMSMPKLNGVEATRLICNERPAIRVIGLSMFEEAERAQAIRDAGAVDYLTKSGPAEVLLHSIRTSVHFPATGNAGDSPARAHVTPDPVEQTV